MKKFLTLLVLLVLCSTENCSAEKLSFKPDTNFEIDYHVSQKPQEPILVDDNVNSLQLMKNEIQDWQQKDEYYQSWNLENTGIYQNSDSNKEKMITKTFIRYAERRAQEIFRKKKKKNESVNTYGLRTNLLQNPQEEDNKYRFRLSSTPTRGRLRLILENPFVELYGQYAIGSKDELGLTKMFEDIKVKISVVHSPLRQKTTLVTEKFINENLIAKFSNFDFIEKKMELLYSYPF